MAEPKAPLFLRFFLDAPLPVVATVWFVPPNFHWTRYDNTQLLICVLPSFETFFFLPSFWLTQRSLSPHTMRWCHTSVQIINHTLFCSRFCGKRQLRRQHPLQSFDYSTLFPKKNRRTLPNDDFLLLFLLLTTTTKVHTCRKPHNCTRETNLTVTMRNT